MGVGGVLDTGVNVARRHYGFLVTVTAWAIVPAYVAATLLSLVPGGKLAGIGSVITGVAGLLASAAIAFAVARLLDSSTTSEELTVGSLYRAARARFWPIFGLGVVTAVAAIPLVILFPLGIYVLVRWSVSWVAVILDGHGPIDGIKRSWELTRGSWWHTLVVALGAVLLVALLQVVVGGIFIAAAGGANLVLQNEALSTILAQIGSVLVAILIEPFSVAMFVVLYYELLARTEGFDLLQRAQQAVAAP